MMGPSHALSGAAAWLAGSWALDHFAGYAQSPLAVAVGTTVCAGRRAAARPRPVRQGHPQPGRRDRRPYLRGVLAVRRRGDREGVARHLHRDQAEPGPAPRPTGTAPSPTPCRSPALVGWGTTALCAHYGKWAVVGIVFFMAGLALRGLFDEWAERAGWLIVTLCVGGDRLVHRRQPARRPRLPDARLRGRRRLLRPPARRHHHQERRTDPLADPDRAPDVADDRRPERHRRQGRRPRPRSSCCAPLFTVIVAAVDRRRCSPRACCTACSRPPGPTAERIRRPRPPARPVRQSIS